MIIGIVHHDSTKRFLPALLKSLKPVFAEYKHQVVIVYNNKERSDDVFPCPVLYNPKGGFELGALAALMAAYPEQKSFFMLQDTTVIKNPFIFDIAIAFSGSLAMCPGFASFLGKYRRCSLEKVGIPIPGTREAAIYYEKFWNVMYMNIEKPIASCDEPMKDTRKFEMKFGKKRMVLENSYMKKWKSNWKGFKVTMDDLIN